jgi:hypothetical protein
MLLPKDFVDRWQNSQLNEQQAAQSHFNELCRLVGHKTPTELDPHGEFFTFEENVTKATGGKGRADVWYKGHFAWEYKGKHKDLDMAYSQLSAYRGALGNPPLLVVCDFLEYRIYPQWVNTSGVPFKFTNQDLLHPDTRRFILWLLESPQKFLELRQTELERREQITLDLAMQFAQITDMMREYKDEHGNAVWQPMQIARFLTKVVFTLFAEDAGLLPQPYAEPIMHYIVKNSFEAPDGFREFLQTLFEAMDGTRSTFQLKYVPYFNGGLFAESAPGVGDQYEVLDLTQIRMYGAFDVLLRVSNTDWRFVNPTIFGTLFEGALDVNKRAQLGAHYTSESDIRVILEPVLMQPLYDEWDTIREHAELLFRTYFAQSTPKSRQNAREKLIALHDQMMTRLETITVLDPACGSGNFLYVSLRLLKDLEAKVRYFFEPLGLPFRDVVSPRQLYGIEKDEFAGNLAKIVVWIGYLQWRYEHEGILYAYNPYKLDNHPHSLSHPVIKDKNHPDEPDRIIIADAILRYDTEGKPYEPTWQPVDVIVGNPPFLGDKKMRGEFEDDYISDLRQLYSERVAGGSDLVCYWFEKARAQIQIQRAQRAGLLATNSIRGGANQAVLRRIKDSGDIFLAHADREWRLDGAAVRISMVGFDDGRQQERELNGFKTAHIHADLTGDVDLTRVRFLEENPHMTFIGVQPGGEFDMPADEALAIIRYDPRYKAVLRPYYNAQDIVGRWSERYIIDFGTHPKEDDMKNKYPTLYQRVLEKVYPTRKDVTRKNHRDNWWIHAEARPGMRDALAGYKRYLVTPMVSKHRVFTWLPADALASNLLVVITTQSDYDFGVLHSRLHEVWTLRLGTSLVDRPRYSPTSTFTTFPFPQPYRQTDKNDPHYHAISACAKQLHEERQAWLDGADLKELGATADNKVMKDRTLTNLYNQMYLTQKHLTLPSPKTTPPLAPTPPSGEGDKKSPSSMQWGQGDLGDGGSFTQSEQGAGDEGRSLAQISFPRRLAMLHRALDEAVCRAYGWDVSILDDEEAMLLRLLELNIQRAKAQKGV